MHIAICLLVTYFNMVYFIQVSLNSSVASKRTFLGTGQMIMYENTYDLNKINLNDISFQNTLSQSQDRAFRRISELKEQIQLDQKAKQDLEENYNLVIEEKGEFIKVLQMQVFIYIDSTYTLKLYI